MSCAYRFVLELRTIDGHVVHREVLRPDWEPAVEATRLAGLRTRGVWQQADNPEPHVEPLWHEAAGQPLLHGVRLHMARDGEAWFADFPTAQYFGDAARAIVAAQLSEGRLVAEDKVRYAIAAYEGSTPQNGGTLRFDATDRPPAVAIRERGFHELVAQSLPCGDIDPADIDVVLPEYVLDEMCTLTREAGERETGGVLLGHLCRDDTRGDIGVEVTAHVPARHTVGDAVKLTFTSDTWTDVRAAVALRKADELLVGWWHSHPAQGWCKACPIERQRVCQFATGFLSSDDRALHRAMFPAAYTQALVVTNSVVGLETRLFGWRHGVLQPRGFGLRRGSGASTPACASIRPALLPTAGVACANETELPPPDAVIVSGH